jgi:hypothetical protein
MIVAGKGGLKFTLPGGFSVLPTPPCAFSVAPQSIHAPASGVSGSLIVSSSFSLCSWTANTSANWIVLSPPASNLPLAEPYSIAPNSDSSQRTGSITIAGQTISVTQDGASACSYAISPGSTNFTVGGGVFSVNVTTSPGCSWAATSGLSWVSISSGASGTGNGSVGLQAGLNSAGLLSGALTIAGQPFLVSQGASSCFGLDITGQVKVTSEALLAPWDGKYFYTQRLRLVNQGAALAGPLYVGYYGLCPSCLVNSSFTYCANQAAPIPSTLISERGYFLGLAAGQAVFFAVQFADYPSLNGTSITILRSGP